MARHKPDGGPQKTLERVISKAGLGSRTEARRWIHAGRVMVNGRLTENPDQWVDLNHDAVSFDGKPLAARERLYVLLYKPKGYLTTYKDPEGRPTVYDLLGDTTTFLSPVGRLDLDTSGLLILTNDTQFAERVTNPDSHVPKTYLVKASTLLTDEQLNQLRAGVELNDGPTRPATVNRVRDSGKYTHLEITLTEGRNRQVRRMIDAVGSHVLKLVRVNIGPIAIGTLQIGKWRFMTSDEITRLGGRATTTRVGGGTAGAARKHDANAARQHRHPPASSGPRGGLGRRAMPQTRPPDQSNGNGHRDRPRGARHGTGERHSERDDLGRDGGRHRESDDPRGIGERQRASGEKRDDRGRLGRRGDERVTSGHPKHGDRRGDHEGRGSARRHRR